MKDAAFQRMKDHLDMITRMKNGMKKATEKGLAIGIEQGIQQGLEQGLEQGIINLIETLNELGISKENTMAKLKEKFDIDDELIVEYINKYWK